MTVRKKFLTTGASRAKLFAPPELEHVLRTIRRFNPEGEVDMPAEVATAAPEKKATKKVVKKVSKKVTKAKAAPAENMVTLAELAKAAKVEPMTARRYLRNSKIKQTGSRWAWPKGSGAIGEVKKLLATIGA